MTRIPKKSMRTFLFNSLMMSLLVTSGCVAGVGDAAELVGAPAPYARLTMLDGEYLPLEAYKGKHTALFFWATWCGHSRNRIEEFDQLAAKYARRKDVAFIAVSIDKAEDFEALKGRIKSQDLKHVTHAFSGNDIQDEAYLAFRGHILPYILVVDPKGTLMSASGSLSEAEDYFSERFE